MNAAPNTQVNSPDLEQERRRIALRLEEVAKLSESGVAPGAYYGEMLKRLLESLAAPAGAVWIRTAQGHLQLQYQINLKEIGLEQSEEARQSHEELLRQAIVQPRPFHVPPRSGGGVTRGGQARRRQPHRSFAASDADCRQSAARRHHRSLAARQPPAAGHRRLPAIHDLHGRVVLAVSAQPDHGTAQRPAAGVDATGDVRPPGSFQLAPNRSRLSGGQRRPAPDRVRPRHGRHPPVRLQGSHRSRQRRRCGRAAFQSGSPHAVPVRTGHQVGREADLQRRARRQFAAQGIVRAGQLSGRKQQQTAGGAAAARRP